MNKSIAALSVATAILSAVALAEAQQTGKVPRLGLLISASPSIAAPRVAAFQQGLGEVGYVEGKNLIIEYRYAEGRPATLPQHVNWHRAATYVDILKGVKPSELPVEQPRKFDFVINLKAGKQMGLTISPNVLARADRVIK